MTMMQNLLHGGQVAKNNIHGVHGVGADWLLQVHRLRHDAASQNFMQHVPADQRHEPDGDLKWAVLPTVSWESDIQVNL